MALSDLLSTGNLETWVTLLGVAGLLLMGLDKLFAVAKWGSRVSERLLWTVALVGGFWGIILGALIFNHKTSKRSFWPPVVLGTALWVSLLMLSSLHWLDLSY